MTHSPVRFLDFMAFVLLDARQKPLCRAGSKAAYANLVPTASPIFAFPLLSKAN